MGRLSESIAQRRARLRAMGLTEEQAAAYADVWDDDGDLPAAGETEAWLACAAGSDPKKLA